MITQIKYASELFAWWRFYATIILFIPHIIGVAGNNNPISKSLNANPDSLVVEFYPIPSPDEILEYIDKNSLYYKSFLLNNPKNVEIYNTSYDKKLGFGIYSADLAYALSFKQTGTVLNYFRIIDDMGRELNLFPSDIENFSDRFIKNINRDDSLKNLYTESYLLMFDHLDESANMGSYVIISAGSFVESIYFALNSVKSEANDDAYRLRIWNQKLVFEQLLKIANRHLDKVQKERLFKELSGIKRVFDTYTERPKPVNRDVKPDGTIVLGKPAEPAGNKPGSVQELKMEIDMLRKKWVKR